MKYGLVSVAAATPKIKVADVNFNGREIEKMMRKASEQGAEIIAFPELCLTGATCGDLFLQKLLISKAKEELIRLIRVSKEIPGIFFVGIPFMHRGSLYDAAAVFSEGELLGMIPKSALAGHGENSDSRYFASAERGYEYIDFEGELVPFGRDLLFALENENLLTIAVEIGSDLWMPNPPGTAHALCGANVIVNLCADCETTGKSEYRKQLVSNQSGRLHCAYVIASAGEGESTTDLVFAGHNLIAENGVILSESERFRTGSIITQIDVERLNQERMRNSLFISENPVNAGYLEVEFELKQRPLLMTRQIDPAPFIPKSKKEWKKRCEEILMIQALGLKKRLEHTNCSHAVIGISGGLDSTLALLVTAASYDLLGKDRSCITAVTMPCFGTTDRTYRNACELTKRLGAQLMEVDIKESVRQHFKDIGHDEKLHDVTYENSQARERTQVLMDIANRLGGMVIGTGDMSELALGWATYNGDHMSMYGVNAAVPKTLVRHLVRYYAECCGDEKLSGILLDILETPVSPELLPPKDGEIAQKTEDIVGPYELHDFFIYYVLRYGFAPEKIYYLARNAFTEYNEETIKKWLKTFYRRFFSQQFKRSCLADGPKVGSVGMSPRGDLKLPSDACAALWLEEAEKL